jgi:hypothetical protein
LELKADAFAATLSTEIDPETLPESLQAQLRLAGSDLNRLIPPDLLKGPLPSDYALSVNVEKSGDRVSLQNIDLTVGDTRVEGQVSFGITDPTIALDLQSSSPDANVLAAALRGERPKRALPIEITAKASWDGASLSIDNLDAASGQTRLAARGQLTGAPEFTGTDLFFDINVDDLSRLRALLDQDLPAQSLRLQGEARGGEQRLVVPGIQLDTGDTHLQATAVFDYREEPSFLVTLRGSRLDANPFLPKETDSADPETRPGEKSDGRLIPDVPIDITPLTGVDGNFDVQIDEVLYQSLKLADLELRGRVDEGELAIQEFSVHGDKAGRYAGNARLTPDPAGTRVVTQIMGEGISMALLSNDEQAIALRPRYKLNAGWDGQGETLRQLAASLNGYVRIDAGSGKIKSSAMSGLTNDFITEILNALNPFSKEQEYQEISCVALVSKIENGRVTGDPAVVFDTAKLNITAGGRVNLDNEKLTVNFRTIPRKGLGVGLSNLVNPFIQITGTLAAPALNLDAKNAILQSGANIATGGMAFVAQTALNRALLSKEPCQEALQKFDAEESVVQLTSTIQEKLTFNDD